jgi:hypothetical protein
MTSEQYEKYDDEFLHFEQVENKTSNRADLHAFNLLDRLLPGDRNIVSAAEHDQIWLEVTPEELAKVATEAQILELVRCGVHFDRDTDSLAMFV